MGTARNSWLSDYRLARQLNNLRRSFIERLPDRGIPFLVAHAAPAAIDVVLRVGCDPLAYSIKSRLRFTRLGCAVRIGQRARLPI